jgi:hypothetical protein
VAMFNDEVEGPPVSARSSAAGAQSLPRPRRGHAGRSRSPPTIVRPPAPGSSVGSYKYLCEHLVAAKNQIDANNDEQERRRSDYFGVKTPVSLAGPSVFVDLPKSPTIPHL